MPMNPSTKKFAVPLTPTPRPILTPRAARWLPALLAALGLAAAARGETFYLKGSQSGKLFGPYTYEQGATVTVGKVSFEIVRNVPPPARGDHPEAEHAALVAAEAWLKLVDRGDLDGAWDEAAAYLKATLSRAEFDKSMRVVTDALGDTTARKLSSIQFTDALPSAPDGQYVVIRYAVERARKQRAVETIIPMLDKDGVWRVSGYNVR
jgi:hypothetical protein